jgi:carboxylesterase type B
MWETITHQNLHNLNPLCFGYTAGGGFVRGSSDMFNGGPLATHDVVVVAINYRLGYFGFLYGEREDAPGNQGLYDQLLALQWVCNYFLI